MKTTLSNISYEEYIKDQLMSLSSNFIVKSYKRANEEDWLGFKKGKDLRIQIQWKKKCIWEWITESSLWIQRNTNKEDRLWMRRHADPKIELLKNYLIKKKPKKKNNKPSTIDTGHTQECFEKMKKK